ncbi:MAG: hypothetical protein IJH78_03635 [Clostridia bacterium]|nr:hypothetical protein [Clostridia bacterium]
MKKSLILTLALLMAFSLIISAAADVPQVSSNLFSTAKEALRCLASGEYERLVTILPFSGISPGADEWRAFAGKNFSTLQNGVQTEYAVAYWNGSGWCVAVPLSAPSSDSVEVFALLSGDGQSFSGYRYANWGYVRSEMQRSDHVVWNKEYVDASLVIAFD